MYFITKCSRGAFAAGCNFLLSHLTAKWCTQSPLQRTRRVLVMRLECRLLIANHAVAIQGLDHEGTYSPSATIGQCLVGALFTMGVPKQADMRQLILGYQTSDMVEKHKSRIGQSLYGNAPMLDVCTKATLDLRQRSVSGGNTHLLVSHPLELIWFMILNNRTPKPIRPIPDTLLAIVHRSVRTLHLIPCASYSQCTLHRRTVLHAFHTGHVLEPKLSNPWKRAADTSTSGACLAKTKLLARDAYMDNHVSHFIPSSTVFFSTGPSHSCTPWVTITFIFLFIHYFTPVIRYQRHYVFYNI
jgi:hypothetical protein